MMISTSLVTVGKANAQTNPLAVPVDCGISLTCIQNNWKTFVGDRLAVMVTNQIIQRMTASVVNWINTGFEGSPAFITNPEGFFLDVADQITGELVDRTGILSNLCSPFSFDIRMNIALNQAGASYNKRYECTLSKMIGNTINAVETAGQNSGINIYGSADGVTLGNFMNGDFKQGGWGGFLVYTTEPQNNPFGAYLMAQSDLQSQIDKKKTDVNNDLNRGQGFMSWQKCNDVTAGYTSGQWDGGELGLSVEQEGQLRQRGNQTAITGQTGLGKNTSIQKKVDPKTGIVSYQDCQTQTPGSMIASTMFNQADTGREKLVSVKTISDSIDAITNALVNQMLTQGLAALSNRGSGFGGNSGAYLTQLYEESYVQNNPGSLYTQDRSVPELAESNISSYNESLTALNDMKNRYVAVDACFDNKIKGLGGSDGKYLAYGNQMRTGINLIITSKLNPLIASTTDGKISTQKQLDLYNIAIAQNAGSSIASYSRVENSLDITMEYTQAFIAGANDAARLSSSIKTIMVDLEKDVQNFETECTAFPRRDWLGR